MRLLFMIAVSSSFAGCFWESNAPDFYQRDNPLKLVVIWDKVTTSEQIERASWQTTNEDQLAKLAQLLDTNSWQSSTVLPSCRSTRIIFTMSSDHIWEICQSLGSNKRLNIFNRNDPAWSGWIDQSGEFVQELTMMIETEISSSIDLTKDYREEIMAGTLVKAVPRATLEQLRLYPGYPEMIWNKDKQEFEYAN